MAETKSCKGLCGEEKPVGAFGLRSDNGKRKGVCRKCVNTQKRARWKTKTDACKDASEHNYGKKLLPDGFALTGVSQLVDASGDVKIQWLKSKADKRRQTEILMEAMASLLENYTGLANPAPEPTPISEAEDLLAVIPLGDPHIGLHCWGEEVGEDFDLKIAAANMRTAIHDLMKVSPDAAECLIINLGDYFHADNGNNTTSNGTPVDVDGRRVKVVRVGLDIFIEAVDQALLKFPIVRVICVTGNHDADSSKMLALMLEKFYSREPRVHIETAPTKHHRYRFGRVLIGTTHGDTGKDVDLGMIMATDWKADWSASEYRHWYKGHVHHDSLKEHTGGVIVETLRTLAPADAWHKGQGYRSGRNLKLDIWHREWGFEQRYVVGIRKIRHLQREQACMD